MNVARRCRNSLAEAGVILIGIVALPVIVVLYCIPPIRETFSQLVYEDSMLG